MAMDVDDFYQLLADRGILVPPSDPDDSPKELILDHLQISQQQAKEGQLKPVSALWDDIDDNNAPLPEWPSTPRLTYASPLSFCMSN